MSATTFKPTHEQLLAAQDATLRDVMGPGLQVLFVGINPSLYTAAVGHHFARPGNRFWPALADGGFTPRLYHASEDAALLELGLGITNLVARATARADELSTDEQIKGFATLKRKLKRFQPAVVAFVGITAYRIATQDNKVAIGPQPETLAGCDVWVLPNPSGLNAHYQRKDFAKLFTELRKATLNKCQEEA